MEKFILEIKNNIKRISAKEITKIILPVETYQVFYRRILEKTPLHHASLPSPNEGFNYMGVNVDFNNGDDIIIKTLNKKLKKLNQ